MFTGLVLGTGVVEAAQPRGRETRLTVRADFLGDVVKGESIAVNGACLTAEAADRGRFSAYASAETLSKSSLGGLRAGAKVNLERALALG
ncbi:MAG TPA: riboflavin synthase, partial [Desulfovibrio sp.]|nr:riboflavin synthase [Desulfovibrio sp.]